MVKGHPKVDDPRVGSIVDSKVDGKVLKVKLDDVDPDFAEEVKKGGFKYLSAAVYSNLKKGLRHLGALGAVGPAMKGMAPLCFGEGLFADSDKGVTEQDVSVFAEPFAWDRLVPRTVFESLVYKLGGIGRLFRSQREQIIEKEGIEAADKVLPEYAIKDIEEIESVLKDAKDFPRQQPAVKSDATADTLLLSVSRKKMGRLVEPPNRRTVTKNIRKEKPVLARRSPGARILSLQRPLTTSRPAMARKAILAKRRG